MNILYGKNGIEKDKGIPIQKHTPTRYLANCAENYSDDAVRTLKKNGYFNDESKKTSVLHKNLALIWCVVFFVFVFVIFPGLENIVSFVGNALFPSLNAIIVGADSIPLAIFIILLVFLIVRGFLNKQIKKYEKYTEAGIKLVKYLEGLELYINMAEADRLKFLQSVEGADTSNTGIVKLYEKLLPWASLFGAEESWAKELAKYYEVGNVEETMNSDVLNGIIVANIAHDLNRTISSSISYTEPRSSSWTSGGSGGSWSSSSSGSSGGGFSGGGGGGGGGGGW